MRKNFSKYIISIFFILLFISKGIISLVPFLSDANAASLITEMLADAEKESSTKNSEEKSEIEKESAKYDTPHVFELVAFSFDAKKLEDIADNYSPDVHIAIPTPPPKA
jgi:hypothetical protein